MATPLKVVEQNTAPQFQITCDRDDGSIIVLTDCTVTMKLWSKKTQTNIGNEACTIIDADNGVIGWQPEAGNIVPGKLVGDVTVTYSDTTFEVLYGQFLLKARKLAGS